MRSWRYVESAEDGEVWLENQTSVSCSIEYSPRGKPLEVRRLMVATKAWVVSHLNGGTGGWAVLPRMLVVPDGPRDEVERSIDSAVATGALDAYSEQVEPEEA